MIDRIEHEPANEADWLALRLKYIGASEAAAIHNRASFSSPWSVWARKTGRVTDKYDGGPMATWGHRHEPAIADAFTEQTGRATIDPGEYFVQSRGILAATIDRWQVMPSGSREVLEIKCAWYAAWDEWRQRVPVAYQIQIQHQLYCTGCEQASVAVLGNGYEFKLFHIARNESFIEAHVEQLTTWWEKYVIGDTSPHVDGHTATADTIGAMYPNENGKTVDLLGKELQAAHEAREVLGAELKAKKKQHDEATNKLKAAIGAASAGRLADGTGYTLSDTKKGRTIRRVKKCLQE